MKNFETHETEHELDRIAEGFDPDRLDPADYDHNEYESCTDGDYGPSNPWDAPGMRVSDFI